MATTTNYGWTTPNDTDLVKDGAAAIRTLGSSVDTTTKALNPSTTLGDVEYRSATANTNTRLGIGTTGQVLTVTGGVPTWATPVTGTTFSGCRVTQSAAQTIANASTTTLNFNTETFDVDGYHDNVTNNNRLTIPSGKSGYFLIFAKLNMTANATGGFQGVLRKNGSQVTTWGTKNNTGINGEPAISIIVSGVPTDFFDLAVYQDSSGNLDTIAGTTATTFGITYLGA
jgi:hypothetical protein